MGAMRMLLALLTAGMLVAAAGCTLLDRSEGSGLVKRSQTVYATVPVYPGATALDTSTSVGHSNEGGPADIGGTLGTFRLPNAATIHEVERFYRERLTARGWKLREHLAGTANHSAGPVDNYTRGRTDISINLDNGYHHGLEIGVSTRTG